MGVAKNATKLYTDTHPLVSLQGHQHWWMMWVVHIVNDTSNQVKQFTLHFHFLGLQDGFVLDKVPNSCK